MRLNNKGFALSTTLYVILILAVVLVTLTLSVLSNRKVILDKQKEEASTLIYEEEGLSYRQVLAILKLEAIKYAEEHDFLVGSFQVNYSNIEEKTLRKYKLYNERLLVQKNGNTYDVYIKDLKQQLPKEYQQVEYIESNGTQYIDTDFIPNQDTRLVVDWNLTYTPTTTQLIGTRYYNNANERVISFGKWNSKDNYNFYWVYASSINSATSKNNLYNSRHIFDSNKNHFYVDGDEMFTTTYTSFTSLYPIYLFAMADNYNISNPPGPHTFTTSKLYNAKIYDNGVLKRNFIPCYRKSDGVIGLYDIVNGVFYTNKRSSSFTKGPDGVYGGNLQLIDYTIDSSISDRYVNTSLPSEYQKVEYIQSSGAQYIDTGFTPNQDTRFVLDWAISYTANTAQLTGTRYYNNANTRSIFLGKTYRADNYNFGWQYGNESAFVTSRSDLYNSRHVIDSNKNHLYVDGTELFTATYTSFTSAYPIYLFAMADNYNKSNPPGPSAFTTNKLYNSKIYDNGVLERNFIPCYRIADGVVGLYDVVHDVFYTNQGSGDDFTAGPEI